MHFPPSPASTPLSLPVSGSGSNSNSGIALASRKRTKATNRNSNNAFPSFCACCEKQIDTSVSKLYCSLECQRQDSNTAPSIPYLSMFDNPQSPISPTESNRNSVVSVDSLSFNPNPSAAVNGQSSKRASTCSLPVTRRKYSSVGVSERSSSLFGGPLADSSLSSSPFDFRDYNESSSTMANRRKSSFSSAITDYSDTDKVSSPQTARRHSIYVKPIYQMSGNYSEHSVAGGVPASPPRAITTPGGICMTDGFLEHQSICLVVPQTMPATPPSNDFEYEFPTTANVRRSPPRRRQSVVYLRRKYDDGL